MYIILGVPAAVVNKHQQKTEATRRKLLAAARRVFARHGFEAARIDDIAVEAGHTRGAFYANFNSKEDLFLVLLEEQAAIHLDQFRKVLENCSDEAEKLREVRNYYVSRATNQQWSILVLEFKLYALRQGRLRAKLARAHRSIKAKMQLDEIHKLLPLRFQRASDSSDLQKTTLEGILRGMVLEHAYDPTAISKPGLELMLGRLFDVVVQES